jgi:hypothetical protein
MIIFLESYPSEYFSREAQGDLGAEYDHRGHRRKAPWFRGLWMVSVQTQISIAICNSGALAPREISVCPSIAYHKKVGHKTASSFNFLQLHCTVFLQLLPLQYAMKLSTITLLALAMAPIAMSRRIAHHKYNGNINASVTSPAARS